jgi:hypothetical protein
MAFWKDCLGCSGDCEGETSGSALWLATLSAPSMDTATVQLTALDGDVQLTHGDTVDVVGGGFWYSSGDDCQSCGCYLWIDGSVTGGAQNQGIPNDGTPIAGTTEIPFAEFYSQTGVGADPDLWTTPSGDPARPVGSVDAGIVGNCGSDAWSQQDAGTTVSLVLGAGTDGSDYSGSVADFLNAVFGSGDLSAFASWFAHVAFQNQRTGEIYHMMLYANCCF